MKPIQHAALICTLTTEDEIQAAWNNSRRFAIPGSKNHVLLVATMVVDDGGKACWHSTVRVLVTNVLKVQPVTMITKAEKRLIRSVLLSELQGVGGEPVMFFNSKLAMHYQKAVTADENEIAEELRRSVAELAKSNGRVSEAPVEEPANEDLTSSES